MNKIRGLFASMMELIAPAPKGYVKKVFRKKVEKPQWLQDELKRAAITKRAVRAIRNTRIANNGGYTNAIK